MDTVGGRRIVSTRLITDEKQCDRCGRFTSRNNSRHRTDGLRLCRDCTNDKWLIEKFTSR